MSSTNTHAAERYRRLLDGSNLPLNLHGQSFQEYLELKDSPNQNAVRKAIIGYSKAFHKPKKASSPQGKFLQRKIVKTPPSLLFVGNNGAGKTLLAGCLANELMYYKGTSVYFSSMADVLQSIEEAGDFKSGDKASQIYKDLVSYDFLILDELGMTLKPSQEAIIATKVFNDRIEAYKPTLLISNLNIEELGTYMGKRFAERLKTCAKCTFAWGSYRDCL
jgi:DNA replication protein DnaC